MCAKQGLLVFFARTDLERLLKVDLKQLGRETTRRREAVQVPCMRYGPGSY
jgi:hypothetical protein